MNKRNGHACGRCLAIFGTGSDVGKSIVVTALCRILSKRDIKVAPFKAQNMSNNSGVTPEGLEMGRAQIVQAEAAGIPPHVDMNPILLKPTGETGAQIVKLGIALENSTAREYHLKKESLFSTAAEALERLRKNHRMIVMEGAGSCAEVNLMAQDIVNLKMAEYADAPVVLVGDIHRGGIFAQLIGTLACLSAEQKDRIAGFIINRFRGDIGLFRDGVDWIERNTGKKVFGVLPWYSHFSIEAEDSVAIESPGVVDAEKIQKPAVAVVRLPYISNFTDFDPLAKTPGLALVFVEKVQDLSPFCAVILPGSKNTRFDLSWLIETGWDRRLRAYAEKGGHVLGICGGYQMMGSIVHDPEGLEGAPGSTGGLSLLPVETWLKAPKTTTRTRFAWEDAGGMGYEIHMGQTRLLSGSPVFRVMERNGRSCEDSDGCISLDRRRIGTYVHGLFDRPDVTGKWLAGLGLDLPAAGVSGPAARDRDYDLLAKHFMDHVDLEGILDVTR
jgi:adenosylcobyric acid synthase